MLSFSVERSMSVPTTYYQRRQYLTENDCVIYWWYLRMLRSEYELNWADFVRTEHLVVNST